MRRYLRLYKEYAWCHLRAMARQRADLAIGVASSFIVNAVSLVFVLSIFQWVPEIQGWRMPEMLFVIGVANMARSVHLMVFDNFWFLGQDYVRNGRLDVLLVRPISPLFQLVAERLNPDGLGFLVMGGALTAKAVTMLGIVPSIGGGLMIALALLGGGLIYAGLNLATMAVSLWVMDSTGLAQAIHALGDYARFPLPLFGRGFEIILTFVMPYGFVAYYPCLVLLGKAGPLMLAGVPVAVGAVWIFAITIWRQGLRHYGSTGS